MTIDQCVGPEFETNLGNELVLRLAGAPAEAALPTTNNGLRVDPDKGVWAPAEHRVVQVGQSRDDAPGGATVYPGSTASSGILSFSLVNPSTDRKMIFDLTVRALVEFKIAAAADDNAGYTTYTVLLGYDVDVATSTPHLTPMITENGLGVGHEATFRQLVSDGLQVTLNPGASVTVRARTGLAVSNYGYAKYIRSDLSVRGLGVTL